MVEFVLLFALGFLTAVLLGLVLAPAIHARIVRFTESRLTATMPMSRAELRAARDMERAEYAARNQSISVDLRKERQRRVAMTQTADRLRETAARLRGEMADLERRVETMNVEAGELRSDLRSREHEGAAMKLALANAGHADTAREGHVLDLRNKVRHLSIDVDDLKIDLATRETEVESLKSSVDALRDEKRRLDAALTESASNLKDRDYRLSRDAERIADLDRRLADAVARATDQEARLERRGAELERLKEKLAAATRELGEARSRKASTDHDRLEAVGVPAGAGDGTMNGHPIEVDAANGTAPNGGADLEDRHAISRRVEKLRARHSALVEKLLAADDESGDPELREEIKDIAASMVSLTARREGMNSPLRRILADADEEPRPTSLAARASSMMREN
jgi:DNA repair exonuclease SbcCD ATPase subunit